MRRTLRWSFVESIMVSNSSPSWTNTATLTRQSFRRRLASLIFGEFEGEAPAWPTRSGLNFSRRLISADFPRIVVPGSSASAKICWKKGCPRSAAALETSAQFFSHRRCLNSCQQLRRKLGSLNTNVRHAPREGTTPDTWKLYWHAFSRDNEETPSENLLGTLNWRM